MKKIIAIVVVLFVVFAAGFDAGLYYERYHSEEHYDAAQIEDRITEIAELSVLECEYTDTGKYTGDAKKILGFSLPFTSKEMMISYSGTIKVGPDLNEGMKVDLDEASGKVNVSIPRSRILSHEINEDSLKVMYVKNGVFNSVTPENANTLRKEMKAHKEKSVNESDMLTQADEKAAGQITTFLQSVYPDLEVTVESK